MTEPEKSWRYSFAECCAKDMHQFWVQRGSFRQPTTQCQLCGGFRGRPERRRKW